eukprot:6171916-Pleurochrysis_carterae.AAC.2
MPNRQFQPKSNRAAICITETVSRQRVSATYIGQRAKRTRALPATHPPRLRAAQSAKSVKNKRAQPCPRPECRPVASHATARLYL